MNTPHYTLRIRSLSGDARWSWAGRLTCLKSVGGRYVHLPGAGGSWRFPGEDALWCLFASRDELVAAAEEARESDVKALTFEEEVIADFGGDQAQEIPELTKGGLFMTPQVIEDTDASVRRDLPA